MPTPRDLDLVLVGATGFTGGLTADYLARHAPSGLRWALAGRNAEKLAAVRDRLAGIDAGLAKLELIEADAGDRSALDALAARTRVVATTVGPYLEHGAELVAACAAAGTDYVDLTGESEFVDRMYVEHHETARRSGARLVHSCGFDSIPYDLGVYYTVTQLPDDQPISVRGVVRAGGRPSGGTFQSALTQLGRARQMRAASTARRQAEERTGSRSSRAVRGRPGRDSLLGYWLLPLPTIDPLVVARSGRALPAYGPRFRYSHFAGTKTLRHAAAGAAVATGIGVMAQLPPLRKRAARLIPAGEGPDDAVREKSWFTVDIVAECGERVLHTRVSGGDPGYTETATMLAESALCLALDDNPDTSGQVTPAVAMGDRLLARLQEAGIRFDNVE
ncbi:saccharopine dehydrogenase family protein [Nocardioides coralli]|uniref:saccharopine dehydrogenase family protein n=1 Tax=Nocardioides coralli TaxID=2872154 RepID=UPI001CA3B749|nr:saccharopine dehydrogenase NADP-binding domain-containing protein [Nocardioides coralli]QZY29577.1 saccharopine dehydrogenase NADP-binding domain-containing protein [Nocardioides coralli]